MYQNDSYEEQSDPKKSLSAQILPENTDDSKPNQEQLLKTETLLSHARMATEFGTLQVKLLTEKGCEATDIDGWYKVSEFKPTEGDELAEKSKSWNYAMRLVPLSELESKEESTEADNGYEIIVLRKTERGQLGFELPRNGVVHISETITGNDGAISDRKKQDEEPQTKEGTKSKRSRFSEYLRTSVDDIRWSSVQDLENSESYMNFLKSSAARQSTRDNRIHANTNLRTLSVAKTIPPSNVANDINYTRESYMAAVMKRDTDEESQSVDKMLYRLSLQRKGGPTREKRYSTVFPKTAPVKYNKSALPDSEFDAREDNNVKFQVKRLPLPKNQKQEKVASESNRDRHASFNVDDKVKQTKKFNNRLLDEPRLSDASEIDYKPKMQYGSRIDMGHPWKEIVWEEKLDDSVDSCIELNSSLISIKDNQSEDELEIVIHSPENEPKSTSAEISPSVSMENEEMPIRYIAIPRQKIKDYQSKGIDFISKDVMQSSDGDDSKLKRISVKRTLL